MRHALELERIRTRIATDLHDDVGASLSQVAIMSEVVMRGAEPDRRALAEIAGTSRALLQSMNEIVWAIDPSHDRLQDLTKRMRWFAGETFSASGIAVHFATEPQGRERRRGVEDGDVVHRADGGVPRVQRQVDVQAVHQVRAQHRHESEHRPPGPGHDRSPARRDARRELADGVVLHHGRQRCGGAVAQRADELTDVGLDPAAAGTKGEGGEADPVGSDDNTPSSSQK